MGKNQHVTPKGNKWQVKGAGNAELPNFSTHKKPPSIMRRILLKIKKLN
ncbi:hypothetical protein ACLGL1_08225 [Peptococcus simiae]